MVDTTGRRLAETEDAEWPAEERMFLAGNEAIAEAAIRAGCRFYAGYPISPATEILEHMAKRLPEVGGVCMLPGTEIEAITMVQGAAGAGVRAMTATSSTGFSLMQETLADCANGGWPVVVVNMCRGALQGDYFQTVKGGGHGDAQSIVLAPHTGQEAADLTLAAFDLAQRYLHPVVLFGDTLLARVTETVVFRRQERPPLPPKTWAVDATPGRPRRKFTQFHDEERDQSKHILEKLEHIGRHEERIETGYLDDAEVLVVAFGTAARYAKFAIERLRADGLRVGFFRPVTLSPFPSDSLREAGAGRKLIICYEFNNGQMVYDVRSAVYGLAPVVAPRLFDARGFGAGPPVEELIPLLRRTIEEHVGAREAATV